MVFEFLWKFYTWLFGKRSASASSVRKSRTRIDREPTKHLGPAASGYERRTGQPSDKRIQQEREALERLARAKALGELERQSRQSDRLILDLSGDLSAAMAERDALAVQQGIADARKAFEMKKEIDLGKQNALEAFQLFKEEQKAKQRAIEEMQEKPKAWRDVP